MGFVDKAMDKAMDKLEDRFGDLVNELNELDAAMANMVAEQQRTNTLLEQLINKVGPQ